MLNDDVYKYDNVYNDTSVEMLSEQAVHANVSKNSTRTLLCF